MILKADKEGKSVVEQLCDIALKQGGLSNFNQVGLTLKSIELLPEPKKEPDKEPEPKKEK